jgi:regulator of ribosome biosynthesis
VRQLTPLCPRKKAYKSYRSVVVTKPIPYAFDLTHLLAYDPNPLPPTSTLLANRTSSANPTLHTIARDGAQMLLNQLLTTCPIQSTPDGLLLTFPSQALTPLPRWKPIPKPKAPTKWEAFAKKKGIGKFGGNLKGGAQLEERRKNMVFDEEKGEWVKKWGYKGKRQQAEGEWLVELDEKKKNKEKGLEDGASIRGEGKRERMERARRQERKQRNNERRGKRGGEKVG